jgi:hypothetical protein
LANNVKFSLFAVVLQCGTELKLKDIFSFNILESQRSYFGIKPIAGGIWKCQNS